MTIVGVLVLSMLGALVRVANAQEYRGPGGRACDGYDWVVEFYGKVGKVPVARGLGTDGKVIEVLADEDGKFTILIVMPNKYSCAIKHGEGWGEVSEFLKEDKKL